MSDAPLRSGACGLAAADPLSEADARRERQRTTSWDDATPEVVDAARAWREVMGDRLDTGEAETKQPGDKPRSSFQ